MQTQGKETGVDKSYPKSFRPTMKHRGGRREKDAPIRTYNGGAG